VRWLIVALATALVQAQPATADDSAWREQSDQTVEAHGLTTLEIRNARGRVDLVASPDGRIHLTAIKIVRVADRERARDLAGDVTVETDARDGRYRVVVIYPGRHSIRFGLADFFSGLRPRFEVRITAQVPSGLAVDVRESSGDIRSEGLAGPQTLASSSGDIEVRSAAGVRASSSSGNVTAIGLRGGRVSSTSGDLSLEQISGPLGASTSSGDITIRGAQDSLVLSSVSGDIDLDRAPRGLQVRTSSGKVVARAIAGEVEAGSVSGALRLGVREPLRRLEARTSSGAIRIALDPAVRCAIEMHTSSGSLDVKMPIQMRAASRTGLTGTVRGGSTPVMLRSVSGDITVVGEP
jgi:hypothetical protein